MYIPIGYFFLSAAVVEFYIYTKSSLVRQRYSEDQKAKLPGNYSQALSTLFSSHRIIACFLLLNILLALVHVFISPTSAYIAQSAKGMYTAFTVVSTVALLFSLRRLTIIYAQNTASIIEKPVSLADPSDASCTACMEYCCCVTQTSMRLRTLIFAFTLSALMTVQFLMLYQASASLNDTYNNVAPGSLYKISACGDCNMHLYCSGSSSSNLTLLFSHGYEGSSLDFALFEPTLSKSYRFCAYDRPGYGWSEPSSSNNARDALQHATELYQLLQSSNIRGSIVMIGHEYAGITIPVFLDYLANISSAHRVVQVEEVVLIDPVDPFKVANRGLNVQYSTLPMTNVMLYTNALAGVRICTQSDSNCVPRIPELNTMPSETVDKIKRHMSTDSYISAIKNEWIWWGRSAQLAVDAVGRNVMSGIPLIVFSAVGSGGLGNTQVSQWSNESASVSIDIDSYLIYESVAATYISNRLMSWIVDVQ